MNAFDKYAEEYDRWFDENSIIYKSEIEALKRHIPKGKGLEIGVGTGRFAKPFDIKIGVDVSKEMAKIAEKRGIKVIIAKGEDLPFKDKEFDFVLINTVLEFSENPKKMIEEAKRVLKKGGKIIIGIIDKNSFLGKIYEKKKEKSLFYRDANFLSAKDVIEMLNGLGFRNIKSTQTIFKEIDKVDKVEVKEGYGEGGFVAISAEKV
ncbi:class I SAM-dependent methyltransferase [Methanocaldococcus sp. 16A]